MSVGYERGGGGVSGLWSSLGRVCCERRDCSMVIWLRLRELYILEQIGELDA